MKRSKEANLFCSFSLMRRNRRIKADIIRPNAQSGRFPAMSAVPRAPSPVEGGRSLGWKRGCIILRDFCFLYNFAANTSTMCTRTIRINDTLIEQVRPNFPDDEALQTWMEQQIEAALIQFATEKRSVPPCSYTDEEMYAIVKQRLQSLEDGTAKLIDGDEVFAQIQSRYGFKA